jgi:hypothetical protein
MGPVVAFGERYGIMGLVRARRGSLELIGLCGVRRGLVGFVGAR